MDLLVDLKNLVTIGASIVPASLSASTNGVAVNLTNSDVRTAAIINNGVVTGAAIWTVQMQGSNDGSTNWTNEPDPGALSGNISAAGITMLSYLSTFPYQRAVATLVSGTSSLLSVEILAMKKMAPAAAGYDRSPST